MVCSDVRFLTWSFERLSGSTTVLCWLPLVWYLPCVYPVSLSFTISISKLASALASCWHLALALCSGSVLFWLRALASRTGSVLRYCAGWALPWTPYEVVTLWWVGRLLNGCVSGLKEVGFSLIDIQCSILSNLERR